MRKTVQRFDLILILATISCLVIPLISNAQQLVLTGNIQFLLAENQPMQAPDGILVKDNAENYLPTSLILSNGDVVLNASTAKYTVHSVPASADAVFYSALPGGLAGLTVQNGASTTDYTLMLEGTSSLGSGSLPVIWEVTRSGAPGFSSLTSDYGNLTFSWDAALEPTELSNKKLYVCSGDARGSTGCTWTALPLSNTTPGSYSLTYTGLTMPLSATRFAVATGLSAASTPTQPICTGGTGSVSIAASGGLGSSLQYKLGTGSWQSGSQFTGLTAGTYTVYVKDDLGEEVSVMVTLTDPSPVPAAISGTASICTGGSTTLTASGGTSYNWGSTLGTSAAVTVTPGSTTTYTVTVTDGTGCTDTETVTVTVNTPPTAAISGTQSICADKNTTLTASGGTSYNWSNTLGTSAAVMLMPVSTTTYTVTVTDGNGCTDTETATVTVNTLPVASISGTQVICAGGSTTLTASGGTSYNWSNALGTTAAVMLTPGSTSTYTVTVTDGNGCTDTETATVTVNTPLPAPINGTLTVCSGNSTTLTTSGGVSYLWNGSLGTNASITVSPATNTTYSVTVTDINGCFSTASVTVTIYVVVPPVITFADNSGLSNNDGTICAGSGVSINISGGSSYAWSDGSSSPSLLLAPACTSPYGLTVTDVNGCTITSNLTITVDNAPTVTQITPSSGSAGAVIHIYGNNLTNVTEVKLNGQTGTNLMILSATHLSVSWPSGGSLQQVSLVSPCGTTNIPVSTPSITSITPGAGSVGTVITLTGTNLDQLVSASVGGVDAVILSRSATSARVVVMPGASTGSVSATNATSTGTYSSTFTVNSTPYPYFQQGSKLSNSSLNAIQGSSVSISADGNTALVGAPGDNAGVGAAWVYTRSGTSWSQQSKLVGAGATGAARQGTSVSVSADGNTAVVGGPDDNSKAGAVWVFTRSGTTWTQQGDKLVGSGASGAAQQGINVSVSGDGSTIASGGFADNNYVGAAWTFARYGTSWAQLGDKITGSGSVGAARQGASLSLSENGSRLAMGGYQDDNRQGAVWMFERNDCGWTQQGSKLVGTGGTSQGWQGYSASLSANGNTLVVGALSDNSLAGAAWVYTYAGGSWTQQVRLVGTQAAGAAKQGSSVTLSADGNTIMVGGQGDDSNQGAVWVYKKSGANWTQQGSKIKGSGATGAAKQGTAVSLSANGTTALIGGPTDNTNKGAFWVYVPATTIPSLQQDMTAERQAAEPGQFRLDQNVPNPATGRTVVSFCLPEAGEAEWTVADMNGRVVQSLRRIYPAGENTESFELGGYSGVYSYSLRTGSGVLTKRMVIVR